MKAIVCTQYGAPDVLRVKEMEKPVPAENDLLIRVQATHINYGDIIARNFKAITPGEFNMPGLFWLLAKIEFGFRKPKKNILGSEFSGTIEATGKAVTKFKAGDAVFGFLGPKMGAHAEYICIPQDGMVALKPDNMSFEEAASIPYGGLTALNLLRKIDLRPGQKVLIIGASGAIGSAAVQLAKTHFGAEVTGICSTQRIELVKSLGADHVIDYTTTDFTRTSEQYDLIFDILGKASFTRCKKLLKPNGRYLAASFKMKKLLQTLWTNIKGGKKLICALSVEKKEDLIFIQELIGQDKLKSIVDKRFLMEQAVEAHQYIEQGHKKGNVVIQMT